MKIFRVTLLNSLVISTLLASEPSAFGAGDLDNPNPYGLSKTETTILQTKKQLQDINVKNSNQSNEINSLRDRIDGIQSVMESISASTFANKNKLNELEIKNTQNDEYSVRVSENIESIQHQVDENKKNIDSIKLALKEISKVLDAINSSYVTKAELNKLSTTQPPKASSNAMSNPEMEAKANDAYKAKEYKKAKELFVKLIDANYKPAKHSYMVGEIEYYTKNYQDAIAYFKKSAGLYDKAEYMPTLLFHTAMSMDQSGDKAGAKNFFEALIAKYPESKEAKMAEEKLK